MDDESRELLDRVRALIAERDTLRADVDRLRALPVIATCGVCRWCHPSDTCAHPKAHAEAEIDGCACAPPAWCPLRGAR